MIGWLHCGLCSVSVSRCSSPLAFIFYVFIALKDWSTKPNYNRFLDVSMGSCYTKLVRSLSLLGLAFSHLYFSERFYYRGVSAPLNFMLVICWQNTCRTVQRQTAPNNAFHCRAHCIETSARVENGRHLHCCVILRCSFFHIPQSTY